MVMVAHVVVLILYFFPNSNPNVVYLSVRWEMEDLFPPEPWFNLKIHYGVNEKGGEFESSEEVEQPNIVRKSWSEFKRCSYSLSLSLCLS